MRAVCSSLASDQTRDPKFAARRWHSPVVGSKFIKRFIAKEIIFLIYLPAGRKHDDAVDGVNVCVAEKRSLKHLRLIYPLLRITYFIG